MRTQRELAVSEPIPAELPPAIVVQALQTFNPVIRHLGTLSHFEQVATDPDVIANDPFFTYPDHHHQQQQQQHHASYPYSSSPPPLQSQQQQQQQSPSTSSSSSSPSSSSPSSQPPPFNVSTFRIYESVTLAPGITKEVNYPTHFQSIGGGCRCRADGHLGVVGWVEFKVMPKSQGVFSPDPSTPGSLGGGGIAGEAIEPMGSGHSVLGGGVGADGLAATRAATGMEEWELRESLVVEGNSLVMPFIATSILVSHQGLVHKILDEVLHNWQEGYNYATDMHTPVSAT